MMINDDQKAAYRRDGFIVVPDLLGPDGFGQIGFAAAYLQLFVIVASLGTAMFLTR